MRALPSNSRASRLAFGYASITTAIHLMMLDNGGRFHYGARMQRAFTLVELAIVLVIIGLIIGGVLVGQTLIRQSQVRAIATEFQRYSTGIQAFHDKYLALPGDMTNATAFWGTSTACGGTSATGTCNGDGNATLSTATANSQTGEVFQFWRQMALAGLVSGNFTGVAGPTDNSLGTGDDTVISTNAPKSRMDNVGWSAGNITVANGDTEAFAGNYGNFLSIGAQVSGTFTRGAALKAQEAWSLDEKIDDASPGTGKVLARFWSTCTTSASNTDTTGNYKLTDDTNTLCSLVFVRLF
jgi:prepilin-type N-terminal cleavage/methylation domain-containing protein